MSRRVKRMGMWFCAACAFVLTGMFVFCLAYHAWAAHGKIAVGLFHGNAEIAWSDANLKRQSIAYNLSYPEGNASILVAPGSVWRPTVERASVGVGSTAGPTTMYALSVLYVPLWPWAVLFALAAGGLWRAAGRRIAPGHCAACGYDLRGLRGEKCPECGRLARMLRAAVAWLRGAGAVRGMG